ncbi:MAG TPA: hypothetical protein VFE51_25475 [Verrucomicrobiae bacterium]|nr:hypothetical protein [Verrucomicrobiae bacterium]
MISTGPSARADSASLTNGLELIPENEALWKESLLWDKDVILRTGVGYKDNVLLSPGSGEGSGFVTTGLDLTLFRLPLDGWEFSLILLGDDIRYFRKPGGLSGEDLLVGSAQLQRYFRGEWRAGLEVRYSYVDQVLQELLSAGGVQAIEAKGNTLGTRPFVRRELATNWWVQLEAPLARDWWQAPLDATWKWGGQAVLGLSYGAHSQIVLEGGAFYIPHDEWLARDVAGNELPGKRLALWREVAELKWDHHFDAKNRWSTATRLGFTHSRDNGGGFYDSYRYSVSQELRFLTPNWEMKGSAGFSYYQFPVQTIATPPAPTLHLATVHFNLRVERRIYKSLRCFGAYEYEQTDSDDPASRYAYHMGTSGVSWEF